MIKGRLGFKWRGAILIGAGVAVPVLYVALAGGPGSQKTTQPDEAPAVKTATVPPRLHDTRLSRAECSSPLPPDDDDE